MLIRTKAVIGGFVLTGIAICAAGWTFLVGPGLERLETSNTMITQAEDLNQVRQAELDRLSSMDIVSLQTEVDALREKVPAEGGQSAAIRHIEDLVSSAPGVSVETLRIGAAPVGAAANLEQINVAITVTGTRGPLDSFLSQLQTTQLFKMTSLSLRAEGGAGGGMALVIDGELMSSASTEAGASPAQPADPTEGVQP